MSTHDWLLLFCGACGGSFINEMRSAYWRRRTKLIELRKQAERVEKYQKYERERVNEDQGDLDE